jgi:membrane associated rhomboid family serine protease
VYWLIGINVLIFAVMRFLGMEWLTNYLAMIPGRILQGWIWTFATYMFVHGGMSHIFFNMLALFIFGVPVEQQMGSKEFLLFYFVTGILAGVFSFGVYYLSGSPVALVGASGAIFAVELAYAILFPHSVIYIWAIIPVRAPILVLGFTALALVSSIFGFNRSVAHFTHLAGFGFAWLYFLIRLGINPWTRLRGL